MLDKERLLNLLSDVQIWSKIIQAYIHLSEQCHSVSITGSVEIWDPDKQVQEISGSSTKFSDKTDTKFYVKTKHCQHKLKQKNEALNK
jgi:hypothetical protein